jgi:hypothetical protein
VGDASWWQAKVASRQAAGVARSIHIDVMVHW